MCLTEPCCSPRESQAQFSASTEAEKSFKPGRKIRCDPQMRRDGWRNSSTVDLWFPSHTTEPHRCCGKDGEEADNSQHLFLIQKINRMELHHPCPCAEAEACAGHAAVGLIWGTGEAMHVLAEPGCRGCCCFGVCSVWIYHTRSSWL